MNKEKIALLIDSGACLPNDYYEKDNVFVLPLRIIFKDREYVDKVDISSMELFAKIKHEIPSTSLPTGEDILNTINEIRAKGYEKIIAITIAAALSGTNAAVNNIIKEYASDLETVVINTKNISLGAGMFVAKAVELVEADKTFAEVVETLYRKITETKIFFTVDTLEYLKKGGRVSSFAATVSDLLNIKPIITCDEEGYYKLIAKERGKKKSHERLIKMAKEFITEKMNKKYSLGLLYGETIKDFEAFKVRVLQELPDFENIYIAQVGPALGVHTGPDAMGLTVQLSD